jgi:hypothetical protein
VRDTWPSDGTHLFEGRQTTRSSEWLVSTRRWTRFGVDARRRITPTVADALVGADPEVVARLATDSLWHAVIQG